MIAKSFARIHAANLINAGILPLIFVCEGDYDTLAEGAALTLQNVFAGLENGQIRAVDEKGREYLLKCDFTARQIAILKAGGLLNYTREGGL